MAAGAASGGDETVTGAGAGTGAACGDPGIGAGAFAGAGLGAAADVAGVGAAVVFVADPGVDFPSLSVTLWIFLDAWSTVFLTFSITWPWGVPCIDGGISAWPAKAANNATPVATAPANTAILFS